MPNKPLGHDGHDHGPTPETTKPSHVGSARPIQYPIRYSKGDMVRCANNGHKVTMSEVKTFATKAELQTYICDCVINGVNVAD